MLDWLQTHLCKHEAAVSLLNWSVVIQNQGFKKMKKKKKTFKHVKIYLKANQKQCLTEIEKKES